MIDTVATSIRADLAQNSGHRVLQGFLDGATSSLLQLAPVERVYQTIHLLIGVLNKLCLLERQLLRGPYIAHSNRKSAKSERSGAELGQTIHRCCSGVRAEITENNIEH